jgi:hypothetical protein
MEAENINNTIFREASQTMYPWSRSLEIVPRTKERALYSMKMGRKHEKCEFWQCPLNPVLVITVA